MLGLEAALFGEEAEGVVEVGEDMFQQFPVTFRYRLGVIRYPRDYLRHGS